MPWMSENDHSYNANRNPIKNQLYLNRAKNLLEPDKFEDFRKELMECTIKDLDRDMEFRLALDCLELISLGVPVEEAASIFTDDVDLEIKSERISPIQACIARDIVSEFGPENLEFSASLPEGHFLRPHSAGTKRK